MARGARPGAPRRRRRGELPAASSAKAATTAASARRGRAPARARRPLASASTRAGGGGATARRRAAPPRFLSSRARAAAAAVVVMLLAPPRGWWLRNRHGAVNAGGWGEEGEGALTAGPGELQNAHALDRASALTLSHARAPTRPLLARNLRHTRTRAVSCCSALPTKRTRARRHVAAPRAPRFPRRARRPLPRRSARLMTDARPTPSLPPPPPSLPPRLPSSPTLCPRTLRPRRAAARGALHRTV